MSNLVLTQKGQPVQEPSFVTTLFNDKRSAVIWLFVRIWLGWQWFESGRGKITNPAWMQGGEALKGYWTRAVQVPAEGRPPIAYDWYRNFIQSLLDAQAYTWFAKVIAISEILFGIALIAGILVGLTAFFSGFMNWNFIMAGTASVNGVFFALAVLLILAWKIGGYLGLDYYLLPRVANIWMRESSSTSTNTKQ